MCLLCGMKSSLAGPGAFSRTISSNARIALLEANIRCRASSTVRIDEPCFFPPLPLASLVLQKSSLRNHSFYPSKTALVSTPRDVRLGKRTSRSSMASSLMSVPVSVQTALASSSFCFLHIAGVLRTEPMVAWLKDADKQIDELL